LVHVIHKYHCPTFLQLQHDGPLQSPLMPNMPKMFEGPPLGASAVKIGFPVDLNNDVPRELTVSEIEKLVDIFASAAVRAQNAGFDGVESVTSPECAYEQASEFF
jgi:2,4-dienoyl-CoA reductase-like NADH-dependent reductase (Old Yellow Enzyme family)